MDISGVIGSQGSLFGVLGERTLGAGADVSVLCVVSEAESDGLISKEVLSMCCGILESTSCVCVFRLFSIDSV